MRWRVDPTFQGMADREAERVRHPSHTKTPFCYLPREAAQILRCSVHTIYRWLKSGKLMGARYGGVWRVSPEDVRRLQAVQTKSNVKPHAQKGGTEPARCRPRICPRCDARKQQIKAGCNRTGTQRFLCQVCGRSYTLAPAVHGYSDEVREQALQLDREGLSLRHIARQLGVNHQSVANWINARPHTRRSAKKAARAFSG